MTFHDLIEKEHKLITVMGVFGAIAAFSIDLNLPLFTFSSFGIFLLLTWELLKNIPSKDDNRSIAISSTKIFEILILFGFLVSIYLYFAKMAFVNESLKKFFILLFVITPWLSIVYRVMDDWSISKDVQYLKNQRQKFYGFWIIVVLLSSVIFCELVFLTCKFIDYIVVS
jgi:hypothetical protein